jgi:FkbM family methyltransferase
MLGRFSELLKLISSRFDRLEARQTIYLGGFEALTALYTGHKIYVDTRDVGISSHLMWEGRWEANVEACLVPFAKPGMNILDIGANFGFYTLILGQAVGPTGSVHAFEANPHIATKLRKSVAVNGLSPWTHVHALALSDRRGEIDFSFDPSFSGGGAIGLNQHRDYQSLTVPTAPLDSLLPADLPINIIKMDVEGAEAMVLAGGQRTFNDARLTRIVTEFFPAQIAKTMPPMEFLTYFTARGFDIQVIEWDGVRKFDLDAIAAGTVAPMVYLLMTRGA